ncbi:MAG TPA: pyruvate dehydrogenase (acetyl-transferring), homodimeric type, partial [Candidatus Saccharimonadales bacterium]|nr:pyruvate dehydrogenase (acetyl-transferring), homodimeric type [Candidatus Saccharimonadales bacterium]
PAAADTVYSELLAGAERPASTTMAFSRLVRNLVRDPQIGRRIVPIIPDEARTFGMDPLFKEVGIYNPLGQRYTAVDKELLLSYLESTDGQILEEGITEAGAMADFTAAGTSYATHGEAMIPFYIFYSMFGFQRTGDQIWAFGDARGRGFMMGATAGRTTLTGEGLQHDDGQSHVLASSLPNVLAYDPAFAYELAIIVREGIRRMYGDPGEDVFYYLTLYNENWVMPPKPDGVEEGVLRGLYRFRAAQAGSRRVQLLGSGSILHQALRAADLLAERFDVAADVWSVPSFQQLRNEALEIERWNRLHPNAEPRTPFVVSQLAASSGPIVAATDYMKAVPDMVARWVVDRPYTVLGTDGFGRSDTREALRAHFEVNPEQIAYAALHGLCQTGEASRDELMSAIGTLKIDPDRVDPLRA